MMRAMVIFLALMAPLNFALAQTTMSYFARRSAEAKSVVVFVHGVMGDSATTWQAGNASWPLLLTKDSAFDGSDVFVLSYPTSLWGTLSIDEIAENMRLQLDVNGVTKYNHIIFLAHSMGGLVTRAYLLKNREIIKKTSYIYFFSTPTTGSQIARLASMISGNPQLTKMKPMNADDFLADQLRQWLAAPVNVPSYCAYEKRATYGLEVIVDIQSASALCNKALTPIDADHLAIVKPTDMNSTSYQAFKAAYLNELSAVPRPSTGATSSVPESPPQGGQTINNSGKGIQFCTGNNCRQIQQGDGGIVNMQ